ncbi:hypothetical protein ACTODO_00504 [Schaalia dentiphila ATCC 17982]|nr:hypothetical protein ACTODO_00504 [Schaalia odontolytica ATCC 17982]
MGGSSPLTRGKRVPTAYQVGGETAHPRSRGENGWPAHNIAPHPGSSPLTRGKPGTGAVHGLHPRLIPAHAGKTQTRRESRRPTGAHPRSRGENSQRRT